MRLKGINVPVGLDLTGLSKGVDDAVKRLSGIGAQPLSLTVKADQSKAVADEVGKAVDGIAARLTQTFAGLGSGPGGKAFASLAAVADRTAGTIITGFRRIDSEISFPKVQATLQAATKALVQASAVPVVKGAAVEAGRGIKALGPVVGRLWDAGPVARYWADYEARGKAALEKVRLRDLTPKTRGTVGTGPRISLAGSRVSKQDEATAAGYERSLRAADAYRNSLRRAGIAAQILGLAAKTSFQIAGDYAKVAISPVTLLAGGYIRLKSTIASISLPLTRIRDVAGKGFSALFGGANQAASGIDRATRSAGLLRASVRAATATTAGLTSGFKSLGVQVAAALGVFGLAFKAVTFIKDGVTAASDLNESISATKQVFGDAFGAVEQQAARLQKAFGIVKGSQLDAAAGFGSIVQGAGYGQKASAAFSNTFTQLAADLSSFKNITFEDSAAKLRSALAGESEPLRQFGVVIGEAEVKAEALRLGLVSTTKDMTAQSKVAARASLIQQGLAAAQGDLARTAGGAANQFRLVQGNIQAMAERIGAALLPAVTAGARLFNEFFTSVSEGFTFLGPVTDSYVNLYTRAFDGAAKVVRNFSAYWEIARLSATQAVQNIIEWAGVLPDNISIVTGYIGTNWRALMTDMANRTATAFGNIVENGKRLAEALADALSGRGFNVDFKPLLEGFQATAAKFPGLMKPALTDLSAEMDAVFRRIEAVEEKRVENIAAAAKAAAAPAAAVSKVVAKAAATATPAEPKKTPEVKLASAVEASSKEAYSAIVTNRAASGREKGLNDVSKNTRDTARILGRIEDKMGRPNEGPGVFNMGMA